MAKMFPDAEIHMGDDASATTSTTTVAAAVEKKRAAADCSATAEDATPDDAARWEFRLTADRRRILIPVNQA